MNQEQLDTAEVTSTTTGLEPKVILFNDSSHSFEEVVNQIVKATGYSASKAEEITNYVHEHGKGIVYSGDLEHCLNVSWILGEINLHTQIEL